MNNGQYNDDSKPLICRYSTHSASLSFQAECEILKITQKKN